MGAPLLELFAAVHPQYQPAALVLDAGDQAQVKLVDLDDNGYSGIVIFDMAGVRVTLETGSCFTLSVG